MNNAQNVTKIEYTREKLKNFILFITEIFGQNNILLQEFGNYAELQVEDFLKIIISLASYFEFPQNTQDKKQRNIEKIQLFLAKRELKTSHENMEKMLRYLDMFLRIL
jgi:hypothetical protein